MFPLLSFKDFLLIVEREKRLFLIQENRKETTEGKFH